VAGGVVEAKKALEAGLKILRGQRVNMLNSKSNEEGDLFALCGDRCRGSVWM